VLAHRLSVQGRQLAVPVDQLGFSAATCHVSHHAAAELRPLGAHSFDPFKSPLGNRRTRNSRCRNFSRPSLLGYAGKQSQRGARIISQLAGTKTHRKDRRFLPA
jgi:hypothetical protein